MAKKGKGKAQGRAGQKQKQMTQNPPQSRRMSRKTLEDDGDWSEDNTFRFRGFAQKSKSSPFTPHPQISNQNQKLRHQGISFVSAANLAPQEPSRDPEASTAGELDDSDSEDDSGDSGIDDSAIQTNIVLDAEFGVPEDGVAKMSLESSEDMGIDTTTSAAMDTRIIVDAEPLFILDTVGDPTLAVPSKASGKRPMKRAPSPARSDSSGDVVLFRGRSKPTATPKAMDDPFSAPARQAPAVSKPVGQPQQRESPHPTDDLLNALTGATSSSRPSPATAPSRASPAPPSTRSGGGGWASAPSKHERTQRPQNEWAPAPFVPYWKQRTQGPGPEAIPAEQRAFAYSTADPSKSGNGENLASLKDGWKKTLQKKKAEKSAKRAKKADVDLNEGSFKAQSISNRRTKRGHKKNNREVRNDLLVDEDDDTGGETAYDDYMQNLIAQMEQEDGDDINMPTADLRAVAAMSGPSLVIDGEEIPEGKLLSRCLKDDEDKDEGDESDEWDSVSSDEDDELMDSSELEDDLDYTERQQWEDEDDLRQRRMDRMTDEQLAKLFEKQQEMGIDADELIIDDGGYVEMSDDGVGDLDAARAGFASMTALASNKRGMSRRGGDKKYNFQSASALADAVDQYGENGFDIMDFERPSLRPLKKGRKGKMPEALDTLSDDVLKETLADSWANDRKSKKQRKLEREELRAQGLLGSAGRKGKADLNLRYPQGMDMKQVHTELRDFLQSDLRERSFPPMDKADRKALHEICVALNLNSKSQGGGKRRFPIVYKTMHTIEYSQDVFVKVLAASERGFLNNRGKAKKFAKKNGPGRGGGFSGAAVGLRNGDIVGAGAAEISHTSFGAKMLAKYGWSKGQGLGKDGEGLRVPVEQVMRVGTAGLG